MKKQYLLFTLTLCFFGVINTYAQVPSYVPTDSLVAWWPFSGNAIDSSGNSNDGTVNGATLTTDRFGNSNSAYYFSSAGCATRIDATVNTNTIQSGLTISVWVSKSGNGCIGPRLLEFRPSVIDGVGTAQWGWDNSNSCNFGSRLSTGTTYLDCNTTFTPRSNNVWTHLVYTHDGDTGRFYQDGVLLTSIGSVGNPILGQYLAIGRMNHSAWDAFKGKLDDMGVWSRALSSCEVTGLYASSICTTTSSSSGCTTTSSTDTITSCNPYTWTNGVTYTTSNNTATDTFVNAAGCDSIVTLNLTISGIPGNGLIGYWPFNGNANDESGNGNNGTVNGASLTDDRYGDSNSAYYFDGINDYIDCGDSLLGATTTQSITVNSWVKMQDSLSGMVISKYQNLDASKSNYFMSFDRLNSRLRLTGRGTNVVDGSFVSTGDWVMLTAIYQNGTNSSKIYVNGSYINQGSLNFNSYQAVAKTLIGRNAGSPPNYFKGKIDDIGIWNRALNATEIAGLYSAGTITYSTDTITSCGPYTWTDGITYTSSNNTAMDTFVNALGCDSIVTLNLTITSPPSIYTEDSVICAGDSTQLSLQTVQCDMNITNISYTPAMTISGFTYGGYHNGHYYYVGNSPSSWTDAEALCRSRGGYLVCINDSTENSFVSNLTNSNIWIGLFRDSVTCQFRWLNCININYTNWRSNEPNSGPCGEPYAQIIRGCSYGLNTWNNLGNNSSNGSCYSNMVPILEIDTTLLFNNTQTVLWSTGDTTASINVSPDSTTTYYVIVGDSISGCKDSITITVNKVSSTDTITSCGAYTWTNNETYTTSNNTATDTFVNAAGCDSIVTLNLTLVNANIIQEDTALCEGVPLFLQSDTLDNPLILVDSITLSMKSVWSYTFNNMDSSSQYIIRVDGLWANCCGHLNYDVAFGGITWSSISPITWNSNAIYMRWNGDTFPRPTVDVYRTDHTYDYNVSSSLDSINISFYDRPTSDNIGALRFQLFKVSQESRTYLWSTGDTTTSISVSSDSTSSYWVTVSDGTISCSDTVTVTRLEKTYATIDIIACDSVISPTGKLWNTTGTHYDTIINSYGCDSIITFNVIIGDTTLPQVITQNLTVSLDANGSGSIAATQVDNGSTDNCGIVSYSLSDSIFNCSDVGTNTVWLRITDRYGNVDSASAVITVQDVIKPTVVTQNLTVSLDATGAGSITATQVDNGSTDNCTISTRTLSKSSFDCSNVGANTVYLIVTDVNGNVDSASAVITVQDVIKPTVVTQNLTVSLDATGAGSITATQVDNGSTDNCTIATRTLSTSSFDCSEVGANTVYLIVTDVNGNIDSASAVITVQDIIKPTVLTQNLTVSLDATGAGSITATQVDNGSTDNCTIATRALSKSSFDCSNVGANTVYLIVTDVNGNVDSASAVITVQDVIKPTVVTQNLTVSLDATGAGSITATQVDNGSTDNCTIATRTLSKSSFDCSDVGTNTIWLRVTDVNGNVDSASAVITVQDIIKPTVITQNLTVSLDASGAGSVTATQVDNGSTDNCTISTRTLSKSSFDCSEVGANTVYLIVTDANGNVDSASAVITVQDVIKPTVVTQNLTVSLDATGSGSITATQVDNGSTDNCTIATRTLSKSSFDCSNVGTNTVYLIVTDVNGNVDSASAVITVQDVIKPTVVTQNLTVSLDATGSGSITATQVDNGSSDNCTIATRTLSKSSFDCSEVGANTVYLIVTDVNGNVDSASAVITVQDVIKPTVITQNLTVSLDATGAGSITATQVDNGSTDNCTISTRTLSKYSFDCSNVGANTVYLIVTDVNGNVDSASAVITVQDVIKPTVVTTPNNIALGYCDAKYTYPLPTATDNCGVAVTQVAGLASGSVFPVGITTNTFEIKDPSGNTVTTSFTVDIRDRYLPFTLTDLSLCENESKLDLNQGFDKITFSGNGMKSDGITFNPIISGPGVFTIRASFIDSMGCTTFEQFNVEVRPSPVTPFIRRVASDQIVTAREYDKYQWYRNGTALEDKTEQLLRVYELGIYSVLVGNTEKCFANSEGYGFGIPVNQEQVTNQGTIKVYPNPTEGLIFIEMSDGDLIHNLSITNGLGVEVLTQVANTSVARMDMSSLPPGTYFLQITSTSTNASIKLVKM
jgi:hypothetical protein